MAIILINYSVIFKHIIKTAVLEILSMFKFLKCIYFARLILIRLLQILIALIRNIVFEMIECEKGRHKILISQFRNFRSFNYITTFFFSQSLNAKN